MRRKWTRSPGTQRHSRWIGAGCQTQPARRLGPQRYCHTIGTTGMPGTKAPDLNCSRALPVLHVPARRRRVRRAPHPWRLPAVAAAHSGAGTAPAVTSSGDAGKAARQAMRERGPKWKGRGRQPQGGAPSGKMRIGGWTCHALGADARSMSLAATPSPRLARSAFDSGFRSTPANPHSLITLPNTGCGRGGGALEISAASCTYENRILLITFARL